MLIVEVILVIGAFLVLVASGAILVRNVIILARTGKRVMAQIEPKTTLLISQADAAQRRSLSISEGRDTLAGRMPRLRSSLLRLRILISALGEAWQRLGRVLAYVGM